MKSNLPSTIPSLPAGKYWVCDPCYAYPNDKWRDFCAVLHNAPGIFNSMGQEFYVWGTAYGDGLYMLDGPTHGQLGVDAGLLAIIPASLVKKWGSVRKMTDLKKRDLVAFIDLEDDADIKEVGGDVEFGPYYVETSGVSDEEESEETEENGEDEEPGDDGR